MICVTLGVCLVKSMSNQDQLYCQSCGAALKSNSTFCTECGSQVILRAKNDTQEPLINVLTSDTNEYVGYVQIVAVVEIALGFFISLIGIILVILGSTITERFFQDSNNVSEDFLTFIRIVIFTIGILLVIFGILSVYFGTRLYQFKQMGRIGTMVIAALQLINIPFGTIFGVIALYLMVRPEVVSLFENP